MAEMVEFDFLSHLPPEVVLKITEYLGVRDVLRSMVVCRSWKKMLTYGELTRFWRRACRHAGLPDYYIRQQMPRCELPNELLLDMKRHKSHIQSITPEIKTLTGNHPFESSTKCEYAGNGYFVKTVDYVSLEYQETVIGELDTVQRNIVKTDALVGTYGEVQWATMCAGNVVWGTNAGYWFRYHLESGSFRRLFSGTKVVRTMGDSIGHCRHCMFFIVAGAENMMHGYNWHFHFMKMEEGKEKTLEHKCKVTIPPKITQFIPRPVKAHILSDNQCQSHRLVIQGGTGACVFKIEHNGPEIVTLSNKPVGILDPFYDSEAAVMVVNTTSDIFLSSDEQRSSIVTSVVYPYASGLCLHIFDMTTYQRIISVKVDWEENFNDAEVLAVTGLYTVLGIGHSKGAVKVVHSRTGKVLLEHYGLSRGLPPVIPMSRLMLCHFQGVYGDECLVDVRSPLTLVVLYRKGIGNIEAVFFDPFPKAPDTEKPALEDLGESDDADKEM